MPADMEELELILASSSPRRERLLREIGLDFRVLPPTLDEPAHTGEHLTPSQRAEALAYFKAKSVLPGAAGALVLGADTIVAVAGQVLGKPDDPAHARWMLQTLSATRHEVITGVALLGPGRRRLIASDVTHVTMRAMTPDEIDGYIASGEWEGKAGAYAIQETADRFVDKVEGSFTNVVGLPIELVRAMLDRIRTSPPPPPDAAP
jgi:septum formation protein